MNINLRNQIRADLPRKAFLPYAPSGFLAIPLIGLIVLISYFLMGHRIPWYLAIVVSILLGNIYVTLIVLGHDAVHGAVSRSRLIQDLIAYPAFLVLWFSPTLWRIWHNQAHHGYTNVENTDPDIYSTLDRIRTYGYEQRISRFSPGSQHWMSALYLFYSFTGQAQFVLWVLSKRFPQQFRHLRRKRAIVESLLIVVFWIALGVWVGPRGALFGIFIPMLVANFVSMSYITTHHQLRPLTPRNADPLENTMSVTTFKWLDLLHLRFSHHVEHHLFPRMSFHYTPLVRQSLRKHAANRFLAPSHWKALWWIYHTPRTYLNETTLIDPVKGRTVDLVALEAKLQGLDPVRF